MMDGEVVAGREEAPAGGARAARTLAAGVLMGIANIIPGVSGGTMILAMGLYERFVDAVADLSRLRFRRRHVAFLGLLSIGAIGAIFAMVGPINYGLTHHQHVMFALFIGLTLGGVPLLWSQMRPAGAAGLAGTGVGLVIMILSSAALAELDLPANFLFLFFGGIIGAAAMVLPGISGSYLLLALGLYFPVTNGLDGLKTALRAGDLAAAWVPAVSVVLPVGLGVLAGTVGLSNLLKAALSRYHQPTLGALLGLLLGSVFFLYPFREPGVKDPFEAAAPVTPLNLVLVAGCIAAGFAMTYFVSRLGDGGRAEA